MTTQETRTLPSRRQVLMSASSKRGEDDLDAAMLKVEATKSRFASSPRFARARPLARTDGARLPMKNTLAYEKFHDDTFIMIAAI